MEKSQVALLLVFVHSLQGREVTELMVEAWAELLDGVEYDAAMEVAREHYRTESRPLWPADIRRGTVDAVPSADSWMEFRR
jgi:hypothetical protein